MLLKSAVVALAWCLSSLVVADDITDRLEKSSAVAARSLEEIYNTWEIDRYPLWLKSMWLPKHSWDHMIAKFEQRILEVFNSKKNLNFTISFTGSSVTAGHDSMFSASYPVVAGVAMKPAFEALGINLVSNNDAMGNNPCMPYDACVATYSGPDADIVHWEQQFNCYIDGDPRMVEQFVRQSRFMPKNPLVIIAGSITPNWHDKDCENVSPRGDLNPEEQQYVKAIKDGDASIEHVFTEMNKGDRGRFPRLHDMLRTYPSAGIQSFEHSHYEGYKCNGPYARNWGDGSASWHPSVLGHKLRGHHYAYLWLMAYRMAVDKVLVAYKKGDKVADMLGSVTGVLNQMKPTFPLPPPVSSTQAVSDNVQCFTQFEPHQDRERTLRAIVVEGISDVPGQGWQITQLEQLLDPNIIKTAHERGYLDEKFIIYGNPGTGPLSMKVTVKRLGTFYICEAPGVWGRLPDGFVNLRDSAAQFFMIPVSSPPSAPFKFSKTEHEKHEVKVFWKQPDDEICVRVEKIMDPGHYVLSVVPTKEKANIMVSTLLVP